ncbi:MAG TPA: sensor histidine kinase [Actinomycetales bacterium]|nr:sensor histidine kinase [Actinomycetales bacterium]
MLWLRRLSRWMEDHPFRVDLIATVLGMIFAIPLTTVLIGYSAVDWWVPFLMFAPLPWRRTRPVISGVLIHGFAFLHWLAGMGVVFPADFAVLVAIYSVAGHGPVIASRLSLASGLLGSMLVGLGIARMDVNFGTAFAFAFSTAALVLAAWAMGTMRAARRERWEAIANRAVQLERDSVQQRRLTIAAERARIAREMHDVVAHSLSIIIAQADGGRYAAESKPELAAESLETIAETGRAALADMRKILGVLRSDNSEDDSTAPQPSLGDIRALIEQSKSAGMRISFVETGRSVPLPAGAEMVLYRVCQESLTNVRKHAGPDPNVTIALNWEATSVRLVIKDDGRGAAAASDTVGHGLLGIRERAGILGAIVTMGPRPGGGFQIEFELPLPKKQALTEEETRWQTPT